MGQRGAGARTARAPERTQDIDRASALQRFRRQADARRARRADGRGRTTRRAGADCRCRSGRRSGGGADGADVRPGFPRRLRRTLEARNAASARGRHEPVHTARLRRPARRCHRREGRAQLVRRSLGHTRGIGEPVAGGAVADDEARGSARTATRGSNPCKGLRRRKTGFEAHYLTDDEFAALGRALDDAEADHRVAVAALRFLLYTGARKSEALRLKWEHVHGDRAVLPDSKTGPRPIWLASPALPASGPSLTKFAAEYVERRSPSWKPSTVKATLSYLNSAILPALGHLRVGSVVRADVAHFFHEYGRRKPGGANRSHDILRNVFDCAIA